MPHRKRTDCSVSKNWELEGKNEMVHMNKLSKLQPDGGGVVELA